MPPRLLCRDLAPPFSAIRPASAVAHVSFFPVPLSASSRRIPVYVYSVTSSVVRVVWVTSCVLSADLFSPSVFDLPCALLSGPLDPLGPIQPLRSVAFQRYTFIPSIVLSVGQDTPPAPFFRISAIAFSSFAASLFWVCDGSVTFLREGSVSNSTPICPIPNSLRNVCTVECPCGCHLPCHPIL